MDAQRIARYAWPGMLLILTGIYAYWATQRELVSSRPNPPGQYDVPDPVPDAGVRTLYSRMWEDPLSSAYDDWKQLPETQRAHELRLVQDNSSPGLEEKVKLVAASPPWLAQLFSWLADTPARDEGRLHLHRRAQQMKQLFRDLVCEREEDMLCLPVFIPGDPYAEDQERRMRIRYAVTTALAESGYHLKYNSRMSYVVARIYVRVLWGWQEREVVVPVKLYRNDTKSPSDEKQPQVLVFWMNESELGLRPLLATNRILNTVFSNVDGNHWDKLHVSIIGPASSGTLEWICQEPVNEHWKIASYMPVQRTQGFSPLDWTLEEQHVDIFSPRATAEVPQPKEKRVKLFRVIGKDCQLANQLAGELKDRGALSGKVVLITEHDTAYGRGIVESFDKALGFGEDDPRFVSFRVLRGIDGRLPGDNADDRQPSASPMSGSGGSSSSADAVVERPPEGRSQYDYLRRLRRRIEELDNVTAIGVMGSDVYDKLLVLRALKPYFPGAVFFTTDLHAIFTHSNERRHTRNLIIASHFGLALDKELQSDTAPFRDSYQTATFLATRFAVHHYYVEHGAADLDPSLDKVWKRFQCHPDKPPLPPRLYVVGRDEIRPLSDSAEAIASDPAAPNGDPSPPRNSGHGHLVFVALLTLLAACGVLGWTNRGPIVNSLFAKGGRPRGTALFCGVLIVTGVALLGWLWITGQLSDVSLFGGYSTSARNVLYIMSGIIAVLALGYMLGRFISTVDGEQENRPESRETPLAKFAVAQFVKLACLILVVLQVGALFVYGFPEMQTWGRVIVVGVLSAVLVAVSAYGWTNRSDKRVWQNLFLSESPKQIVCWVLASVAAVSVMTIVALWCGRPPIGWSPVSISRGFYARFGDSMAILYAFAALGALLATLVFTHLWCWEFASGNEEETARGGERTVPVSEGDREEEEGRGQMAREFGTEPAGDEDQGEQEGLDQMANEFRDEREGRSEAEGEENPRRGAGEREVAESLRRYKRLRMVGKLTAVPGSLAATLMGLLLVVVLAYHPMLSPMPMPMGLLVLASLAMVVFIASVLSLRWQIWRERSRTIAQIQEQSAEERKLISKLQPAVKEVELELTNLRERLARISEENAQHSSAKSSSTETVSRLRHELTEQIDAKELQHNQKQRELWNAGKAKELLETRKQQLEALSEGVFRPWGDTPVGWILGGGASLALVDLWVRWWATGL